MGSTICVMCSVQGSDQVNDQSSRDCRFKTISQWNVLFVLWRSSSFADNVRDRLVNLEVGDQGVNILLEPIRGSR